MMQSEHQAPQNYVTSLEMKHFYLHWTWRWLFGTLNFRGKYPNFLFLLTKLYLGRVRGELGEGEVQAGE